MKWKIGLIALPMLILISGCSLTIPVQANNCAGWERIDAWEDRGVISRDLREQIATHNKFGGKTCDWERPERPTED